MTEEKKDTAWWEQGMDAPMEGDPRGSQANFLRFWMPAGTERTLIFLTNEPFVFWEHNLKMDGHFRNWFTCVTPLGLQCPLCKYSELTGQSRRYKVAAFTVIDTNEYTDKQGKTHKNERRLFMGKEGAMEKLKRKHTSQKAAGLPGLRGCSMTVFRSKKDKSPSCGDDFEISNNKVDLSVYVDSTEFDYKEMLKPDPEILEKIYQKISVGISGTGAAAPASKSIDYS